MALLTSGDHINRSAHEYGLANEPTLWDRFQTEMNGTAAGEWFFVRPANKEWPQDLGYFIGFRIAEAHYQRAMDKGQALRDILSVTDYPALLKASGYRP